VDIRIISGGQTGVDRAALDVALELGLECAGWCPAGRLAEDGRIDDRYPLRETPSAEYAERTQWNVRDSDASLILAPGEPEGGTALAVELARDLHKPLLQVDPRTASPEEVREWLRRHRVGALGVGGPRASEWPEGYETARALLRRVFSEQDWQDGTTMNEQGQDAVAKGRVRAGAEKVVEKGSSRHLVITRRGRVEAEMSLLIAAIIAIFAPWLVAVGLVGALFLDCDISVRKVEAEAPPEDLLTGA
jgi:hypothetical protein